MNQRGKARPSEALFGPKVAASVKVDFFLCGAGRSGTTYFHQLFANCPLVTVTSMKEMNFFCYDAHYARGTDWYHSFIRGDRGLRGDVSPNYMLDGARVAPRILEYNPDAKVIFSLRNPVHRTWSHYWHNVREGDETLPFDQAISSEPSRTQVPGRKKFYRYAYVQGSMYYKLLKPFFECFDPERMLVIIFENYLKQPVEESRRIERFMALPANILQTSSHIGQKVNENRIPLSLFTALAVQEQAVI